MRVVAALLLTAVQIFLLVALADAGGGKPRYDQLCNWDSGWYKSIIEDGYHTTIPPVPQDGTRANVGFFPGYPEAAKAVRTVTGATPCHAMLAVSQVSCWAFWFLILTLLAAWQVPVGVTAAACAAILVHPAAFFLVTGYSESLFMAAMIGFLFWLLARRPGTRSALIAGGYGFVMTATRIVGVPLAFVPMALPVFRRAERVLEPGSQGAAPDRRSPVNWRELFRLAGVGALAAAGGLSFLAFCRIAFGHWDVYMQTLAIGWYVKSDYLAFFHPEHYKVTAWVLSGLTTRKDPHAVSQIAVPLQMYQLVVMLLLEAWLAFRRRNRGFAGRAVLYACAWLLFYSSVSGRVSVYMMGMIRYTLCSYVLLVIAAADLAAKAGWTRPRGWIGWTVCAALAAFAAVMLYGQYWLGWNFVHSQWAA